MATTWAVLAYEGGSIQFFRVNTKSEHKLRHHKQTNLDLWNRFYCTLNIDHAHQIQNFLSLFNFMYDRADYRQKLANTLYYKLVMGISY